MSIFKTAKYIYALSLDETLTLLEEQGADLATINFIKNSEQSIKPLYVKYLKENPNANIYDLQNNVQQVKKPENSLSEEEQAVINSLDDFIKTWATSRLRQIKFLKPGGETGYRYFEDYNSAQALMEIKNKFEEITDMVQYVGGEYSRFDLSTYNFKQAVELSDEWHEEMVEDGAGRFYTPILRNSKGEIVDNRVLKVFKNGWFIIDVDNENDLKVEGNKLNHCVGGYWKEVDSGRSKILSLRNQFNQPQATAEITREGIEQIKGNSNATPNSIAVDNRRNLLYSNVFCNSKDCASIVTLPVANFAFLRMNVKSSFVSPTQSPVFCALNNLPANGCFVGVVVVVGVNPPVVATDRYCSLAAVSCSGATFEDNKVYLADLVNTQKAHSPGLKYCM